MSNVMQRWIDQNPEQGHYACFAGFERDLKAWAESLDLAYDDMDIYQQIQLFAFACELLTEEHCGTSK